jgi:hypothetical protein
MFCPECKSEYRSGFTTCADCGVNLVESLDAANARSADLTAPVLLWSGVDAGTQAEICASLEDAHILYNDEPLDARLLYASLRNPLEIWVQKADADDARRTVAKRFAGANGEETVVAGLVADSSAEPVPGVLGSGMTSQVTPANVDPGEAGAVEESDEDAEPSPEDEIPEQPYDPTEEDAEPVPTRNMRGDIEEQPSVEVWSGKESDMADYLSMCFREDGIRFAQLPNGSGGFRFLVYPDREERARLIVREVFEGQMPE